MSKLIKHLGSGERITGQVITQINKTEEVDHFRVLVSQWKFLHQNWLALPVGNEGPSTFTLGFIGDETSLIPYESGQLEENSSNPEVFDDSGRILSQSTTLKRLDLSYVPKCTSV